MSIMRDTLLKDMPLLFTLAFGQIGEHTLSLDGYVYLLSSDFMSSLDSEVVKKAQDLGKLMVEITDLDTLRMLNSWVTGFSTTESVYSNGSVSVSITSDDKYVVYSRTNDVFIIQDAERNPKSKDCVVYYRSTNHAFVTPECLLFNGIGRSNKLTESELTLLLIYLLRNVKSTDDVDKLYSPAPMDDAYIGADNIVFSHMSVALSGEYRGECFASKVGELDELKKTISIFKEQLKTTISQPDLDVVSSIISMVNRYPMRCIGDIKIASDWAVTVFAIDDNTGVVVENGRLHRILCKGRCTGVGKMHIGDFIRDVYPCITSVDDNEHLNEALVADHEVYRIILHILSKCYFDGDDSSYKSFAPVLKGCEYIDNDGIRIGTVTMSLASGEFGKVKPSNMVTNEVIVKRAEAATEWFNHLYELDDLESSSLATIVSNRWKMPSYSVNYVRTFRFDNVTFHMIGTWLGVACMHDACVVISYDKCYGTSKDLGGKVKQFMLGQLMTGVSEDNENKTVRPDTLNGILLYILSHTSYSREENAFVGALPGGDMAKITRTAVTMGNITINLHKDYGVCNTPTMVSAYNVYATSFIKGLSFVERTIVNLDAMVSNVRKNFDFKVGNITVKYYGAYAVVMITDKIGLVRNAGDVMVINGNNYYTSNGKFADAVVDILSDYSKGTNNNEFEGDTPMGNTLHKICEKANVTNVSSACYIIGNILSHYDGDVEGLIRYLENYV